MYFEDSSAGGDSDDDFDGSSESFSSASTDHSQESHTVDKDLIMVKYLKHDLLIIFLWRHITIIGSLWHLLPKTVTHSLSTQHNSSSHML